MIPSFKVGEELRWPRKPDLSHTCQKGDKGKNADVLLLRPHKHKCWEYICKRYMREKNPSATTYKSGYVFSANHSLQWKETVTDKTVLGSCVNRPTEWWTSIFLLNHTMRTQNRPLTISDQKQLSWLIFK